MPDHRLTQLNHGPASRPHCPCRLSKVQEPAGISSLRSALIFPRRPRQSGFRLSISRFVRASAIRILEFRWGGILRFAALCVAANLGGRAVASSLNSVTLNWDASPSSVIGYRIYFGTANSSFSGVVDVGNSTTGTVSGLEGGVTYYFVVSAYDADGEVSDYSNQICYTPVGDLVPPAVSLELRVNVVGQVTLSGVGESGRKYDIQASADLQNWKVIGTLVPDANGNLTFVDPETAQYPARFYRAIVSQ